MKCTAIECAHCVARYGMPVRANTQLCRSISIQFTHGRVIYGAVHGGQSPDGRETNLNQHSINNCKATNVSTHDHHHHQCTKSRAADATAAATTNHQVRALKPAIHRFTQRRKANTARQSTKRPTGQMQTNCARGKRRFGFACLHRILQAKKGLVSRAPPHGQSVDTRAHHNWVNERAHAWYFNSASNTNCNEDGFVALYAAGDQRDTSNGDDNGRKCIDRGTTQRERTVGCRKRRASLSPRRPLNSHAKHMTRF